MAKKPWPTLNPDPIPFRESALNCQKPEPTTLTLDAIPAMRPRIHTGHTAGSRGRCPMPQEKKIMKEASTQFTNQELSNTLRIIAARSLSAKTTTPICGKTTNHRGMCAASASCRTGADVFESHTSALLIGWPLGFRRGVRGRLKTRHEPQ